tara:strand:- start:1251 stop:1625 length:375 start_codon:yes stop_codon:yes gene_type:complete
MKTTIPKLRKMIRRVLIEHVGDEHHDHSGSSHRQEPGEGYVKDGADMYAQDEDYDGYINFGLKFGYTEDQLENWFMAAEDAIYQAESEAYEPSDMNVAHMDIGQLERDLESGNIDLQRNPYALD